MAQVIRPDSFIENATIIYLAATACAQGGRAGSAGTNISKSANISQL